MPRYSLQELLERGFTARVGADFPEVPLGTASILMAYDDGYGFIDRPVAWWKQRWGNGTGRGKRIAYKFIDINGEAISSDPHKNSVSAELSMCVFGYIDTYFVLEVSKALRKYDALKDENVHRSAPTVPVQTYGISDEDLPDNPEDDIPF